MDQLIQDAIRLFLDGLALVYHEARHVRFLIKDGYLHAEDWPRMRDLPRDKFEAWKEISYLRQAAKSELSAEKAAKIFQKKFNHSLEQLWELYNNPNWRHRKLYGSHEWRKVTSIIQDLQKAINDYDMEGIERASAALLTAKHNTGSLRNKIAALDRDIRVETDPRWHSS